MDGHSGAEKSTLEHKKHETLSFGEAYKAAQALKFRPAESIFGQEELVIETLSCLISGGDILMTGAPGLAKTTLVRVLAAQLGLDFKRIQFTPDLLPTDIIGTEVLNFDQASGKRSFEFVRGPIFTNLLLADEINRASPRTQSALLEGMQERTVTVAGVIYTLPAPFMVFATQNPFESEGTFPLPEAQLDRFLISALVDYPSLEAEHRILKAHAQSTLAGESGIKVATSVDRLDTSTVAGLIERARLLEIDVDLQRAVAELVRSTRPEDETCPHDLRDAIWYGAGPRAGISLISLSRAFALMSGDDMVRWQHIKRMALPALRHRVRLSAQGGRNRLTEDHLVKELITRIEHKYSHIARG